MQLKMTPLIQPQPMLSQHLRWRLRPCAVALALLASTLAAQPMPEPLRPVPRRTLDDYGKPLQNVQPSSPTTSMGIAAQRPGQPVNLKAGATFTDSGGGISAPVMVVIPPTGPVGFMMGSPPSEVGRMDNEKQHRVTLDKPFALSQTEVTWAQWEVCTSAGGCVVAGETKPTPEWGTGQQPVINVSWNQAIAYTQWLNTKLGFASTDPYRYRLPTEAEWEYAARAGNTGPFGFGKDAMGRERNIEPGLARYKWRESYQDSPTKFWNFWDSGGVYRVSVFPPSAFGLYDMHGNVSEWVADCYEADYDKLPNAVKSNGTAHRESDHSCPDRVLRGGSWANFPDDLRAAYREGHIPAARITYRYIGLRLAKMLPAGS